MAHDRHEGHSVAMFRDKFWLSLALTIPVLIWSGDPQHWLGYTAPVFPGSTFIPPVFGTIVFFYCGLVFIRGAQGELADRRPGMMTLISLAIIVAFVTSWAGTLGLFEVEIWWELASLITIMLLGHWLEMRSIAQARGALFALADLLPDTAERVTADGTESVSLTALALDDLVLVRPGARVPWLDPPEEALGPPTGRRSSYASTCNARQGSARDSPDSSLGSQVACGVAAGGSEPRQQSNANQHNSLRSRWSSSTSSRISWGSWARCHWHSKPPASTRSSSVAAAHAALIA
jgi:hypothetical protein